MKKLSFLAGVLALSVNVLAGELFPIPEGAEALSLLSGKLLRIENVNSSRGGGSTQESTSSAVFQFTPKGCLDQMGPVTLTSQYDEVRGKTVYHITAYTVHMEASKRARCAHPNTVLVKIPLGRRLQSRDATDFVFSSDEPVQPSS